MVRHFQVLHFIRPAVPTQYQSVTTKQFWRSCAPGKGVCGGGRDFGSALLQPSRTLCVYWGTAAGAQCLRLSERFFISFDLVTLKCEIRRA